MAIGQAQPTEQIRLRRRLFTVEEYERMIEVGILGEHDCVELISGEIVLKGALEQEPMPPVGFEHGFGVAKLNQSLVKLVGDKALVWPHGPIQIRPNSRPEPDLALLKPQHFSSERPVIPSDVLLVVEVSDITLQYDRAVKGPLYAQASIREYWIINLRDNVIEVYTEPSGGAYRRTAQAKRGETLTLPTELGGTVEVDDILGKAAVGGLKVEG